MSLPLTSTEVHQRLALLGSALGLSSHRLVSRDCQSGFHSKCDGSCQAGRLHPMAEHQSKAGATYDQRLPCFCDCHEEFKPR